jgi:hypothetical protein
MASAADRQRELARARQRKHRALKAAGLEEFAVALPWYETYNALLARGMSEKDALRRELVEQKLAEIMCVELFHSRSNNNCRLGHAVTDGSN